MDTQEAISSLLGIQPGITSIIGSGGKTTLMLALAWELSQKGRVIVSTSTHVFPPEGMPILSGSCKEEIRQALLSNPAVCVGAAAKNGKLCKPECTFSQLAELADFVLVEADGSKGYPIKAHGPWEPVIPLGSTQVILLVGADGFGRPLGDVCHRPEIFARLASLDIDSCVLPHHVAEVIQAEGFAQKIIINQVETPEDWENARAFADHCAMPVFAGSFRKGVLTCLS